MFYEDWKPIYNKIAEDFNFKIKEDVKATDVLNNILQKKKLFPKNKLEDLISGKEVIIFGAGPSLEKSILTHKNKFTDCIKIAADGATSALLENDILPDIIVTDFDGKISDQLKANSEGSIVVIHAHGDNIPSLKKYVSKFEGDLLGSTQINPEHFEHVYNFGGFTDGDRAVFLADYFHAKKISLIGFDFNGEIGKYSFSKNKDKNLKLKKLKWCKYLIDLLKKENLQEL